MKKTIFLCIFILIWSNFTFAKEYIDLPENHWAYGAINEMIEKGVFTGYDDGTIKPDQTITRAEFAKILVKTFDLEKFSDEYRDFKDVDNSHWAYDYIKIAQDYMITYTTSDTTVDLSGIGENKLVKVNIDGKTITDTPSNIRKYLDEFNQKNSGPKFYPNDALTRECAGHDIVRAVSDYLRVADVEENILDMFVDKNEITDSLKGHIAIAIKTSLMHGVGDDKFNPKGSLTRAQVAQLISNALALVKKNRHGNRSNIGGRTVIVAIFANDNKYSWNYEYKDDIRIMETCLDNVGIAVRYLIRNIKKYGPEPTFVYDWKKNNDLLYYAQFNESLVNNNNDSYKIEKKWICDNIDENAIKEKYNADNIAYCLFFNTDDYNPYPSHCWQGDFEIVNIFTKLDGAQIEASTYAHELLHTFGAPDLYEKSDLITQEYVDHLETIHSDDIMRGAIVDGRILEKFSELDAYYVGLLDECNERIQWGLGLSEYQNN